MNIEKIRRALSNLVKAPWVDAFSKLLNEGGVHLSSDVPGQSTVKDVLADARIHIETTARAGISSVGFDELISTLEEATPSAPVLIIGLIGSSTRGVMYFSDNDVIFGGVVIDRRSNQVVS